MNEEINPFRTVAPGEILSDSLECMGWSQTDLAEITGLTDKTISQLIKSKQNISVETAGLLGKAFGKSPEYWIRLYANYQTEKKDSKAIDKEQLAEAKAQMHKYMPVAEMKKKGWFVNELSSIKNIQNEYERIFGQRTIPVDYFEKEFPKMAARQTRSDTEYTQYYRAAWFSFAKFHAKNIATYSKNKTAYDSEALEKIAKSLYQYTILQNGVEKVLTDLSLAGVNFFVLSHLSKTYLDGAAFIEDDKPFVVYTGRYDREDNFWFVLAHEIAHILFHYEYLNKPFLDTIDENKQISRNKIEEEADKYAGIFLNYQEVLKFGKQFGKYVTEERLARISAKTGVSIPVSLGILQHEGIVQWKQFSRFKPKVMVEIPQEYRKW